MRVLPFLIFLILGFSYGSIAQTHIKVPCAGCNCADYGWLSKDCKTCCNNIKAFALMHSDSTSLRNVGLSAYTIANISKANSSIPLGDTVQSVSLDIYRQVLSRKEYSRLISETNRLSVVELNYLLNNKTKDEF